MAIPSLSLCRTGHPQVTAATFSWWASVSPRVPPHQRWKIKSKHQTKAALAAASPLSGVSVQAGMPRWTSHPWLEPLPLALGPNARYLVPGTWYLSFHTYKLSPLIGTAESGIWRNTVVVVVGWFQRVNGGLIFYILHQLLIISWSFPTVAFLALLWRPMCH